MKETYLTSSSLLCLLMDWCCLMLRQLQTMWWPSFGAVHVQLNRHMDAWTHEFWLNSPSAIHYNLSRSFLYQSNTNCGYHQNDWTPFQFMSLWRHNIIKWSGIQPLHSRIHHNGYHITPAHDLAFTSLKSKVSVNENPFYFNDLSHSSLYIILDLSRNSGCT